MRYNNEIELRESLGIDSWQQLSRGTVFKLLDRLQDTDPEVKKKVLEQVPQITSILKSAIDDTAKAHEVIDASNARSVEMVHEIHMERLAACRAQLDRDDLTAEERLRLLDDIREVNANAMQTDEANKSFLATQFDKRREVALGAFVTVAGIVLTAAANKRGIGPGKIFKS